MSVASLTALFELAESTVFQRMMGAANGVLPLLRFLDQQSVVVALRVDYSTASALDAIEARAAELISRSSETDDPADIAIFTYIRHLSASGRDVAFAAPATAVRRLVWTRRLLRWLELSAAGQSNSLDVGENDFQPASTTARAYFGRNSTFSYTPALVGLSSSPLVVSTSMLPAPQRSDRPEPSIVESGVNVTES
jgi:hypothetical protein